MNALEEYLDTIADVSGFQIPGAPDIIAGSPSKNEMLDYVFTGLRQAWKALPPDMRGFFTDALDGFESGVREAMEDFDWKEGADAVPVFGAIVKAFLGVVLNLTDLSSLLAKHDEDRTRAKALIYTIDRIQATNSTTNAPYMIPGDQEKVLNQDSWYWIGRTPIFGYTNYKPRGKGSMVKWSWEPCMPPLTCELQEFGVSGCFEPKGRWQNNNGVPIHCGAHGPGQESHKKWMGCAPYGTTQEKRNENRAEQFKDCFTFINPLWWPFWSPTGPAVMGVYAGLDGDIINDPNEVVINRQVRLLTNWWDNFHADENLIRGMAANLVKYISDPSVPIGIYHIDENGNKDSALFASTFLDLVKREDFTPSKVIEIAGKEVVYPIFYLDESGVVTAYDNYPGVPDPAEWAFAVPGAEHQMTLADVNSVIINTLAFFTVRAVWVQDQSICRAALERGMEDTKTRAPILYAAINECANPTTRPRRFGIDPPRATIPPKRAIGLRDDQLGFGLNLERVELGADKAGGLGIALVIAAAAGVAFWKLRK